MGVPATGNNFIVDDVELSGTVGIEEAYTAGFSIEKIQPNPTSGISSVYYSIPSHSDVTFELFDFTGRKCREVLLNNETAGRHQFELDASGLPSGLYMLHMTSGHDKRTGLLQVIE